MKCLAESQVHNDPVNGGSCSVTGLFLFFCCFFFCLPFGGFFGSKFKSL